MLFSKRLELAKRATRWIAHNTHGDFSPVNIVTALDALGIFEQAVEHRVQRTAFLAGLGVGIFIMSFIAIVVVLLVGCR